MSKSMNTTRVALRELMRLTDGKEKEAVEKVLVFLAFAETLPIGGRRKRFIELAESKWSEGFLASYIPGLGSRGRLPISYKTVEQVQKHLGRVLCEEGIV